MIDNFIFWPENDSLINGNVKHGYILRHCSLSNLEILEALRREETV
jgi:hypothetical protein